MRFDKAIPILYSVNVAASRACNTEVLEFENKWGWEEPPTFGGVSKDCVEVFFCEKGQGAPTAGFLYLLTMQMNTMNVLKPRSKDHLPSGRYGMNCPGNACRRSRWTQD
jgi:hypothetical protein